MVVLTARHSGDESKPNLMPLAWKSIVITPSGALSPGPLSAVAVVSGLSLGPLGGLLVALGHTIVELPYVVLLVKTMERARGFLNRYGALLTIGVVVFLAYFSYLLARDGLALLRGGSLGASTAGFSVVSWGDAVVAGMVLTGLNVYFLLWWMTVGYPLITGAAEHGTRGLVTMYVSHVWMDYAWLALLAAGGGAVGLLGAKAYALLLIGLAAVLAWFAAQMTISLARDLRGRKQG